jgi:hypothetical protein
MTTVPDQPSRLPEQPVSAPSVVAETATGTPARCPVPRFWRRLGAAAFLFFLIKGLLWLLIPAALATGLIKVF